MSWRMLVWVMTAAALASVPSPSFAGSIVGTKHDLSAKGWGTNEICIFCHTPHNAKSPQLAPLWNHASTVATYTLYSSPTMNFPTGQPGSNSKACLSCHDGTVALDSYGSSTGSHFMPGTPGTPGSAVFGTNLSDDHPIGMEWRHQTLGSSPQCEKCHAFHPPYPLSLPVFAHKVECGTCHTPHNNDNAKFLRETMTQSTLCLHCHLDK